MFYFNPASFINNLWYMGIGMLGICGGGGYTLNAAKSEKRVKAVATLSMFNTGRVRREGYMSTQVSDIQERLKGASDARAQAVAVMGE